MNLNEEQKKQVAGWIEQGLKLSEIQSRLEEDLGLKLTYMEVRFLIDDLSLTLKEPEPEPEPEPAEDETSALPSSPGENSLAPDAAPAQEQAPGDPGEEGFQEPGDVQVTVDQLARPGAVVSGKVTFSDGKTGSWYLDQAGRLGVATDEEGYKPSQADLMVFQGELQNELGKMGF